MRQDIAKVKSKDMVEFLKAFKPATKDEAIGTLVKMVPFLERRAKELKAQAVAFIENKCKDCNTQVNSDSSLAVKKVTKHKKVYNDKELEDLELALDKAKKAVAARKKILGIMHDNGEKTPQDEDLITEQVQTIYWQELKL